MDVGDRVRLHYNGDNAPMWLLDELGTVTKAYRARVVVEFDVEAPHSRTINKALLRAT
jgi:hypothetical protein